MFETERLILRESRPSDEAFFLNLFNTYDVLVNITNTYPVPSYEHNLEVLSALVRNSTLFVVAVSKETGAPLGFAMVSVISPLNSDGALGIAIAKEWWAQGYGTEIMQWLIDHSFRSLGLRRLSLTVFSSNPGAVALYEHVGFKHEGRQREAMWKDGKWVDHIFMGLLRREYKASGTPESQDTPPAATPEPPIQRSQDAAASVPPDWVLL